MKKTVAILIFFFSLAGTILAQDMPPPPPLIWSAPKTEEIKAVKSEKCSFQADFPSEPRETTTDIEGGFVSTFKIYRKGSNTIINVYDLKENLDRDKFLSFARESIQTTSKGKIIEEKDIEVSDEKGKEFALTTTSGMVYLRVRIFVIGKRIYELRNDVTNWHILGEAKKKEFEQEVIRFFNSFKLLQK